jgi:hypothetical protein
MTPTEAARLLELPPDATPEQLETRFLELRTKFEDKIAKAPTPGLKAKYRESLDGITVAFETLTLAADCSALPVLQRGSSVADGSTVAGVAVPSGSSRASTLTQPSATPTTTTTPASRPARKSGAGKEFFTVALIAIAVLGAGGWWVMKTRAENAEKERVAAVARVEAERQAENARLAADAQKKAEEDEKARTAAAEKAERERRDRLFAQLRGNLAEHKIAWEAVEREEQIAERRLSELKSDLRSLRDASPGQLAEAQALAAAQQEFYDWLSETLARHPAKIARSKAEEMLSGRQLDDAQAAVAELKAALADLEKQIPVQRAALLDVDGVVTIRTHVDATWTLVDAFGRSHQGTGPSSLDVVAIGPAAIEFRLPLWPGRKERVSVLRSKPAEVVADFVAHDLDLNTNPTGASVLLADGRSLGSTPLPLRNLPPGKLELRLQKKGFYDQRLVLHLSADVDKSKVVELRKRPTSVVLPDRWIFPARFTVETRSLNTVDGSRSTGLYAPNAANQKHQSHSVEEWELSEPDDATGQWQRVVRRFVRHDGSSPVVVNGSVVHYHRASDGKWHGAFTEGGLSDPIYATVILESFDPAGAGKWLEKLWPPAETPVGGTWPIPTAVFLGAAAGANRATESATGRLLAFNHEADRDWAEFEFNYRSTKVDGDSTSENSGSYKIRVDLAGYVMAMETVTQSSSTIKAGRVGLLVTDGRSQSTTTYTKR